MFSKIIRCQCSSRGDKNCVFKGFPGDRYFGGLPLGLQMGQPPPPFPPSDCCHPAGSPGVGFMARCARRGGLLALPRPALVCNKFPPSQNGKIDSRDNGSLFVQTEAPFHSREGGGVLIGRSKDSPPLNLSVCASALVGSRNGATRQDLDGIGRSVFRLVLGRRKLRVSALLSSRFSRGFVQTDG